MAVPAVIEARLSVRGQLRQMIPLAGGLGIYIVLLIIGSAPLWFTLGGVIVLGGLAVAGMLSALRSPRAGVVLRLDEVGVTRKGASTVCWADLRAVRISSLLPWWMGGGGREMAAFIPRAGVEVPGPPTASGRDQEFGYRQRVRRYGSNLVVLAENLTVGADDLAGYAHRVGGLPVQIDPGRRLGRRVWTAVVILGLVSLAMGLLAGLSR